MGSAHDKDLLYPRQREALECPVEQWGIAYRQQALAATNVKSHCGQKDVFRLTCSWSIDSQWLEPFVEAFRENNGLDDVLLHGRYVFVFCCWTLWRHVIGGENRAVTRSHCPHRHVSSMTARLDDISNFLGYAAHGYYELYRRATNHHVLYQQLGSGGSGSSETRSRRSLRVRSAKNFPQTPPSEIMDVSDILAAQAEKQ
jgi:hypothetical protein